MTHVNHCNGRTDWTDRQTHIAVEFKIRESTTSQNICFCIGYLHWWSRGGSKPPTYRYRRTYPLPQTTSLTLIPLALITKNSHEPLAILRWSVISRMQHRPVIGRIPRRDANSPQFVVHLHALAKPRNVFGSLGQCL